jgi:hypothetical protein
MATTLTRIGDWHGAFALLQKSRYMRVISKAPDKLLRRAAMRLERQIKKGLARGSLGLAPLSPGYLVRKLAAGYSKNPLVRTGEAVRTTTTIKKRDFIFVGIPRGVTRHSYGARDDVMNIMKIHHDGNGQRERPFIINAYNQISKQIEKDVIQEIQSAFGRR